MSLSGQKFSKPSKRQQETISALQTSHDDMLLEILSYQYSYHHVVEPTLR